MKTGKCPKCGSAEVYLGRKKSGYRNYLAITAFRGAGLDNYVCLGCGYTESYLSDVKEREEMIRENWLRVEGGGGRGV